MDFQAGVRARLLAAAPVVAIAGARVTWVERPQGSAMPSVTLQVVSDPRPAHLKGLEGARGTRIQADCWAETYAVALALARAVIAALVEPATIGGKRFGHASVEAQRDLGETQADGTFVHRQSVELLIRHVGE